MSDATEEPPVLYALTHDGLESVAADEIEQDFGGEILKTARGLVVFRVPQLDETVLALRTTEDVFLLAWGSDTLTYRSSDLDLFRQWTARKPDWPTLFRWHHQLRPRKRGKPTFHLVCQMQGEHGYRRMDAAEAMRVGLQHVLPTGWYEVDENAWLEIWLTIHGKMAVCGVRLSDRTMRHRTYKQEHIAASLRPTVAAAMVRLAGLTPGCIALDPMCGAGTLLAETICLARQRRYDPPVQLLGGDIDPQAVFVACQNLSRLGPVGLARWDSRALPLADASVDRLMCNPPFGKQLASPQEVTALYAAAAREWDRVLKPGGRAVFVVMDQQPLVNALRPFHWLLARRLSVRLLGQPCTISVWNKSPYPAFSTSTD
ncbi:MAG: methyltransferase [Gemmataceae bacterium]|nr:methyltransferase [Gemmataceae bacterium]MCS7270040.1 methyltransferase [Gemmataceae bacterium]MDW8242057.1 methyltransferase [Thermogemmata sp.]